MSSSLYPLLFKTGWQGSFTTCSAAPVMLPLLRGFHVLTGLSYIHKVIIDIYRLKSILDRDL